MISATEKIHILNFVHYVWRPPNSTEELHFFEGGDALLDGRVGAEKFVDGAADILERVDDVEMRRRLVGDFERLFVRGDLPQR